GLERQTIDQVDTRRTERGGMGGVEYRAGLFETLDAIDRLLHHRIEILDAHRDAVEAQLAQRAHVVAVGEARVDLDAVFAILRVTEAEVPRQRFHQLAHLRGIEEIRRATAEMQLAHRPVAIEQRRDQLDLAIQALEIALGLGRVVRDDPVAAAVETRT